MTIGTKSVLYGAHAFWLHPWFVARAWWVLYGFPWDPRLWVAFFVHDLGYIGKPDMDGDEGERHPVLGASIMSWLFDRWPSTQERFVLYGKWGYFTLLHSRYYAKRLDLQPSRLCVADKLAIALTPSWLYIPMVRATGEIDEYMAHAQHRAASNEALSDAERRAILSGDQWAWHMGVQDYCTRWAFEHRFGKVDTWTSNPDAKATLGDDGVWK